MVVFTFSYLVVTKGFIYLNKPEAKNFRII